MRVQRRAILTSPSLRSCGFSRFGFIVYVLSMKIYAFVMILYLKFVYIYCIWLSILTFHDSKRNVMDPDTRAINVKLQCVSL